MDTRQERRYVVRECAFVDLHPDVGDRARLESHSPNRGFHYGTLVGYSAGESVLVRTPMAHGLPVPYADGEALTVRLFTRKGIASFEAAIQRICTSPFHYLHLEFPGSVRAVRVRATERVRVILPTEIVVGGKRLPATITDLGVGGAMLECTADLAPDTPLTVRVAFLLEPVEMRAAFEVPARVRRKVGRPHRGEALPLVDYGVAFERLTPGQKVMLQNFVYHHLLTEPASLP